MPKVSICIPTYKQTDFLKKNLDSIVVQDYADYEIVVTDDTLDDSVRELVLSYSPVFGNKLYYYKNQVRLGSPENWNEAIRKSNGQIIKMLHHDDSFSGRESLKNFVALLDNDPPASFAFSATFINSEREVHLLSKQTVASLKTNPLALFSNNLIGSPSTTIFRNGLNFFFDKNLKWLVDIDFYLMATANTARRNDALFKYSSALLITTCSGQSHQVTNQCINKEVEIFEYLYLLNKINARKHLYNSRALSACQLKAIEICNRYEVRSVADVAACGYKGNIHQNIKTYFILNSFSKKLGRLFLKLLRRL